MKYLLCSALVLMAPLGPVAAEEGALQEPPAYFLDAVMATGMAQQLALFCEEISINPIEAQNFSGDVTERLLQDGFDITAADLGMTDGDDGIAARQTAFQDKHPGLKDGVSPEVVCAVARAEIEEGSQIGKLLLQVGQ